MARPGREKDLFETFDPAEADPAGLVEVVLVYVAESDKAWLLRKAGRPASQHWVPKAVCTRAEPPHQDVFALPRRWAAERGWL
ncbi:MAG TPA: hypothetical protein VFA22_10515 [Stellaceae bacterium]|nr:hypothetical protein [Stellaceae bacterium]